MRITYTTLITATALALLSACATTGSPTSTSTSQADDAPTASASPSVTKSESVPVQAASAPALQPLKAGPLAEFSKTGTELDQAAIGYIAQNIDVFKKTKAIEVIGYCDRKDNMQGAQQVALARASAVRAELIKQGVASSKIRLKYFTAEARHGVSVLLK